MITLYKGAIGKGKTLTMVKDGLDYYNAGYKVLSNFKCSFAIPISNEDILELGKDSNLFNCVIMIDEIQIFFDSRQSMRKQAIRFSNFIQQIRKRNIIILCTTQYSNTIDLRLRQHLTYIAYPNFIQYLLIEDEAVEVNICQVTYLDLTSLENYEFELNHGIQQEPKTISLVFEAKNIFNLYDTTEMII